MAEWAEFHRRLATRGASGAAEGLLLVLLAPLGWIYGGIGLVRQWLYRRGILPVYRASVPVLSVGNLSAGGTGKTPVVDWAVRSLLGRGLRVAVVSRGYGGSVRAGTAVVSRGKGPLVSAALCGDEPYLLSRRNPEALVIVAPRRAEGVQRAVEDLGAEIVVLDDAFQHLAVARDLNLVLLDGRHPLGNGRVLPAGLLREFPRALRRGEAFLLTRCSDTMASLPKLPGPVFRSRHRLGGTAVSLSGETMNVAELAKRTVVAFAGLADNAAFFRDLERAGIRPLRRISFPDHAAYGEKDLERLRSAALGAECLLTTEKDAVKLRPEALPLPCWQIPLQIEIEDEERLRQMLERIISQGEDHGHFEGPAGDSGLSQVQG